MRSLAIGATGMLAQQTNVDVISNNIANMNTTAYTKRRAEFNDLLYQNIIRPGSASTSSDTIVPSGIQLGLGVRTAAVYRITDGTSLTNTNDTLDLAIRGRGYFQIELPEGKGTAYTRDGAFQRNGDGVIGYVLAIGDIGHNDSIARTRGVRSALGTGVEADGAINSEPIGTNTDGSASAVKDGTLEINGKTYTVRELASQEMKNSAGATWDAATAGNAIGTWASSFGDQIDIVVSNNDGMGMSMFNSWSKDNGVPTFGYDANSDAVAAIAEGYGGTISQHADVQAYLTLRVLRNALDGVDIDTGIGTEDEAGNVLSDDVYVYNEDERSYYALNVAVTADNYQDFTDSTVVWEPVSNQLDESEHPTKSVWLDIYNASDNFLGSTYQPLLQKYDDLLNLDVEYIGGDGQTESNITNRLGNPSQYDAFAINMVKTDNAASYTSILSQ